MCGNAMSTYSPSSVGATSSTEVSKPLITDLKVLESWGTLLVPFTMALANAGVTR